MGSGVVLVLIVVLLYGWRWGYSALPKPVAQESGSRERVFGDEDGELPPGSFWRQVRDLARWVSGIPFTSLAGSGLPLVGGAADLNQPVSAEAPEIREAPVESAATRALAAVLSCQDLRPPTRLGSEDVVAFNLLRMETRGRLREAQAAGDVPRELIWWIALWTLEAAVFPAAEFPGFHDERGEQELAEELSAPFQGRIRAMKTLPLAEARRGIEALAAVTNRLASPAVVYVRQCRQSAPYLASLCVADWPRVRNSFRMAGRLMLQDAGHLAGDLLGRLADRRQGGELDYHGAAHAWRPVSLLFEAVQVAVARPGDWVSLREALVSRTLSSLHSESLYGPTAVARVTECGHPARGWWARSFDRPAVWRSAEGLPHAGKILRSWQSWLALLESCRLALAVQSYRHLHGEWPEKLEALVPEWLEAVPLDPETGSRFRYGRDANGFWLRSPGEGRPRLPSEGREWQQDTQ
jgi:hypothetical protein